MLVEDVAVAPIISRQCLKEEREREKEQVRERKREKGRARETGVEKDIGGVEGLEGAHRSTMPASCRFPWPFGREIEWEGERMNPLPLSLSDWTIVANMTCFYLFIFFQKLPPYFALN